MRSGWAVAAISVLVWPQPATARDHAINVSIQAGPLSGALASLADQAKVSIGYPPDLPTIAVRGINGRMTIGEALDRLLRHTPFRATRVGESVYRIVNRERRSRARLPASPEPPVGSPEITITARKISEPLSRVPAPIAIFVPEEGEPGTNSGQAEVAHAADNMIVAGRNTGAERTFIRGLADSPFDGFSQSTVSVQIDEGRVTYDAAEPGLRLADVARVEVLKGPQGPLYGTGAIGGVYRLVTNRPALDRWDGAVDMSFAQIEHGGPGASAGAMLNVPVVHDTAAIRLVGYATEDGGWVDDQPAPNDANQAKTLGARMSVRVLSTSMWTVDLTGTLQDHHTRDSSYLYQSGRDLVRPALMLEPSSTAFRAVQSSIEGPLGSVRFLAASSFAWQRRSDFYNLPASSNVLGIASANGWIDARSYRVMDQEIRLSSADGAFRWTAGMSYLFAATDAQGSATLTSGDVLDYFTLKRRVAEAAIYGDGSMPIASRLRLELGFRLFRSSVEDERQEPATPATSTHGLTGFTPSMSLSYDLRSVGLAYVRIATAFRPGGIDPGNSITGRYQADEVISGEVGTRLRFAGGRWSIDANAYLTQWRDVQSDYLEANGLLATRNAGDASIAGIEAALTWQPETRTQLRIGVLAQHARLDQGPGGAELPNDRRLPLTPDISFRGSVERRLDVSGVSVTPMAAINFLGSARLSFDDGLDRRMGSYAIVRVGVTVGFDETSVRLGVENAFDVRADTFSYGNPFTIRSTQQYTPTRPRIVTLSATHRF